MVINIISIEPGYGDLGIVVSKGNMCKLMKMNQQVDEDESTN